MALLDDRLCILSCLGPPRTPPLRCSATESVATGSAYVSHVQEALEPCLAWPCSAHGDRLGCTA